MMNKLLGKTVKKVTLISAVLAIIFALAIVLTAILGINYAAARKTLKIQQNLEDRIVKQINENGKESE